MRLRNFWLVAIVSITSKLAVFCIFRNTNLQNCPPFAEKGLINQSILSLRKLRSSLIKSCELLIKLDHHQRTSVTQLLTLCKQSFVFQKTDYNNNSKSLFKSLNSYTSTIYNGNNYTKQIEIIQKSHWGIFHCWESNRGPHALNAIGNPTAKIVFKLQE